MPDYSQPSPTPYEAPYPQLVDPGIADRAAQVYANVMAARAKSAPVPVQPPPADNTALTDIGHGLARGVMVEAPQMFGQALQAFGANDLGKSIAESAKERGKDEAYRTTGTLGGVATMLPTLAGLGSLGLVTGGAGAAALGGAALFGGSQYTETREKGGSVGQALATGAIQSVGQAVGAGLAGRFASGAASALRKGALDEGFARFTSPTLWGGVGRELLHQEAAQLPTQALASAGVAAAEQGLPGTQTPWEAAKQSFGPTALLTAAMAPLHFPTTLATNKSRALIAANIQNDQLPVEQRLAAVQQMASQLRKVDRDGATAWQGEAERALNAGVTPELNANYKYEPGAPPPPPPPADAATAAAQIVANPPQGVMPFAQWVAAQKAMKQGPLAEGGKINEAGLKDAYLTYVNDQVAQQEQPPVTPSQAGQQDLFPPGAMEPAIPRVQEQPFALEPTPARGPRTEVGDAWEEAQRQQEAVPFPERAPEGQGELDLAPVMNRPEGAARPSPILDAAMAREAADKAAREAPPAPAEAPPQTAMAAAMQRAGVTPEQMVAGRAVELPTREQAAEADRVAAYTRAQRADKPVVGQNPTLARVVGPEEAARVAAANKLADDAVAGKINGNTPLARQDFAKTWQDAATEAGMKRPSGSVMGPILDLVQGKTLYVQQLNELRKARDAANPQTQKFESLSRLIARLEQYEGPYPKETSDGVPAETAAQATEGAKSGPATDATRPKAARTTKQGAGVARDAKPGVVPDQAAEQSKTTPEVTSGEPVGYGEFSTRPPTQEELDAALKAGGPSAAAAEAVKNPGKLTPREANAAFYQARAEAERLRLAAEDAAQRSDPTHAAAITAAETREAAARDAFEKATPEMQDARAQLRALDAKDAVLQQMRGQYREMTRNTTPTAQEFAERQQLQDRIKNAALEQRRVAEAGTREELTQRISDAVDVARGTPESRALSEAVGATEKARQRGEGEPAATEEYYPFTKGIVSDTGLGTGTNMSRLFNYLEAHKYAGSLKELRNSLNEKLRSAFDELSKGFNADARLGVHSVKVRKAAVDALKSLDPATHKQFTDYMEHLVKSIQTAARINEPGIKAEKNYARALRQWADLHAKFDFRNAQIDEMVRNNALTPEEGRSQVQANELQREGAAQEFRNKDTPDDVAVKMYNKAFDSFERDIAAADAEKTGLSAIDNAKLAAKVAETPNAVDVAAHLGRTHHNPLVRAVAKLYATANPTASIKVIENPDFNGGRYVPATDTIEIGRGGMNTTTMLHEITHALTHAGVGRALANIGRAGLSAQELREVEALKTVQGVMERFAKVADLNDRAHVLALTDEHEFLSEALNNPDLQRLLKKRGWLGQFFDGVRQFLGMPERNKSDFDALMEAAPTLFGDPNRSLTDVFRRSVNDADGKWFMPNFLKGFTKLGAVDSAVTRAADLKSPSIKEGLAWTTLNHQKQMFHRAIEETARQFPSTKPILDRLGLVHDEFRQNVADRAGTDVLIKTEGNRIADAAWKLAREHRGLSEDTGKMGLEATRLRTDPSLPITPTDSAGVRALKTKYQELKAASEQISRRDPKAATPLSVYHGMVDYHDLMLTRETAQRFRIALQAYGMHELPEMQPVLKQLDAKIQAGRAIGSVPAKTQRQALNTGMTEAMRIVKEIHDREIAAGGAASKGATEAGNLRAALGDQYGLHELQRKVPYMHLGRAGDKMIMFTVKGGQAEWDRVGVVVGGDKNNGLNRGWGPPNEGNRRVYMRFENDSHYTDALKRLEQFKNEGLFNDDDGKSTWADGAVSEKLRTQDSATPQFMRTLRDKIMSSDAIHADTKGEMVSMLYDTFLQQLPDNSPLKASAARDGLNGYSTDYIRSFGDRVTMAAQGLQRLRSSSGMSDTMNRAELALKDLREDTTPGLTDFKLKTGRYMYDLRHRIEDLNRPVSSPYIDRIRAFPAAWRLALAPAYLTMLAIQPLQMTLPALGSKHGFGKSTMVMAKNAALAYGIVGRLLKMGWLESKGEDVFTRASSLSNLKLEFAGLKNADGSALLNDAQVDLLHHVVWSSLLNFGATNQIARLDPTDKSTGAKTLQAVTVLPHMVEIANRLVSALSAHELHMDKNSPNWRRNNGGGVLEEGSSMGAAHDKAKDYALQVIRDTDGDHSQANIARGLGRHGFAGKVTPLVVGFQQFDIQATEMLARNFLKLRGGTREEQKEAAKLLAGVAGMTGMMAGTLGLPFMGAATGLANTIMSWFQDPNDQPPDVQHAIRQFTGKLVGGGKAEEVISRGLPRLLDIDMSTRSGFQDLAPFTSFLEDRRKLDDRIKDGSFEFLGPSIGAMAGIATGVKAASEGDYVKAINDALPAFARNIGKAYRMANYGYETEGANNLIPIAAPSAWNIAAQAAGFQSSARAEQQETSFTYNTTQQLLERRQQILRNQAYRAVDHQDFASLGAAYQQSIKFGMQHPQFGTDVLSGLNQRLEARVTGAATGSGILAGKKAILPIHQMFPQFPNQ